MISRVCSITVLHRIMVIYSLSDNLHCLRAPAADALLLTEDVRYYGSGYTRYQWLVEQNPPPVIYNIYRATETLFSIALRPHDAASAKHNLCIGGTSHVTLILWYWIRCTSRIRLHVYHATAQWLSAAGSLGCWLRLANFASIA